MNMFRSTLVALLLCSTAAFAAPASEDSIKELLAVTQSRKLVDGMRSQYDAIMRNAVDQALQGKTPSEAQQQAIANAQTRMVAVLREELSWERLEPLYLRLYSESFTDEEVAGMLAFYKTPAGLAVVEKMPALMQRTMVEVQQMLSGMMPKMRKVQEQFAAEMAAAGK